MSEEFLLDHRLLTPIGDRTFTGSRLTVSAEPEGPKKQKLRKNKSYDQIIQSIHRGTQHEKATAFTNCLRSGSNGFIFNASARCPDGPGQNRGNSNTAGSLSLGR